MTETMPISGKFFLVEAGATLAAVDVHWQYVHLTSDIEAAIGAIARASLVERRPVARLRVGTLAGGGAVVYEEALRLAAGGVFLSPVGRASAPAIDIERLPVAPPEVDVPPRLVSQTERSRGVSAFAVDAVAFTGAALAAVFLFALLNVDTSNDRLQVARVSLPEPVRALSVSHGDKGAVDPARYAPQDLSIDTPLWANLMFGLDPEERYDAVSERFAGCFEAADGSLYCEGLPPSQIPDAAHLIVRFNGGGERILGDILIQSLPFEGPRSKERAEEAFERLSEWVERSLADHVRSDRRDLPVNTGYWHALTPGTGTGSFERHWAPKTPGAAPYVRLKLVGNDADSGVYLLQISSPAGWVEPPDPKKL